MDCREVNNHLGDAIDRELPTTLRAPFFTHLRRCPRCHIEYLAEFIGKLLIRKHVRHVQTPPDVQSSVVREIRTVQSPRGDGFFLHLFRRHPIPGVAAAIAAVVLVFLLVAPPDSHRVTVAGLAPNDIIRQAHDNFALLRSGDLVPTMVSCEPDLVVGYFERSNVRFAVAVPPMEGCDWYGAIANEYDNAVLAHVVYRIGNDYLYLYQVEKSQVGTQSALTLPETVLASLRETGWYTDIEHDDCSIILWSSNGTLCAAASTLSKDRMIALLAYR